MTRRTSIEPGSAPMAGSRMRLAAAVAFALAPGAASAWDVDWALGLGLEYSDNIARTAGDERSDVILVPHAEFSVREQGTRVQLDAVGHVEYRHYLDNTFGDELRAELAGRANFVISPERLAWTVEDYLAQEPIDVFAADRPDNTQRVNVFVTGPTARFRLAPATFLQAEARYIDTWAEETEFFDGHRYAAALRFLRETSEISRFALNAEAQRARFESDTAFTPDYDRYDVYARYEREGARLTLRGNLGWTWLEFEGRDDVGAPNALVEARWELTPVSTIDATLAQRYTDTAQDIVSATPAVRLATPLPLTDARRTTVTADVFEERRAEAGWSRQGDRLFMRVGAFYREQDYENLGELDAESVGASFDVAWRLSARQTLSGFAFVDDRDFTTIDRDDRDRVVGVRWRWQWLERVWLGAELAHTDRRSSDPLQEFDELRALVTITYTRNPA